MMARSSLLLVPAYPIHKSTQCLGLMLALPIVTLLLTLNMALGILNRVAPQLSVFVIGFPLTLSIGILSIGMMMPLLAPFSEHLFSEVFDKLVLVMNQLATGR